MVNVQFLSKGSIVYSIQLNKIAKYIVEDVFIEVKNNEAYVQYNLKNDETKLNARMNSSFVYEDLNKLKEHMLLQFDSLILKEVETKTREETTVS